MMFTLRFSLFLSLGDRALLRPKFLRPADCEGFCFVGSPIEPRDGSPNNAATCLGSSGHSLFSAPTHSGT